MQLKSNVMFKALLYFGFIGGGYLFSFYEGMLIHLLPRK